MDQNSTRSVTIYMPSVEFSLRDMELLLDKSLPHDKDGLNEFIGYVKGDVESLDGDNVSVDVKDGNRPDIWCPEGIAQALRGYLGIDKLTRLKVTGKSRLNVLIDKQLRLIRPYISVAIVKNIQLNNDIFKGWINLQQKLDLTYGRKRKKASIGLYNADMIVSPLHYTVSDPDKTRFIPLGNSSESTLREIVSQHEKGQEYGHIISKFKKWPLLIDGEDKILSLPPVINSNDVGKITSETRNILVEITGTNIETVHNTLKILLLAFAVRGGKIYSCIETYPYGNTRKIESPNLSPTITELKTEYANRMLGTRLTDKEMKHYIERAGYPVTNISKRTISLQIPSYRIDIMHPVDIVEDIAIAMDVNKLKPEWPRIWTIGGMSKETVETGLVNELMIGLGYQQVLTYALTSSTIVNDNMNTNHMLVELSNPRLTTHSALRPWLLPSLFEFLSHNTHVDYPQKIFETGRSIKPNVLPERIVESVKLAAVTIHATAGFTEIRSVLDALVRNMGLELLFESTVHPSFLTGRCAKISRNNQDIGVIGEISPIVLQNWGLSLPAAAFELDLSSTLVLDQ